MKKELVIVANFSNIGEFGGRTKNFYFHSYKDFAKLCKSNKVLFYFALKKDYLGNMKYKRYYLIDQQNDLKTINKSIQADVIWDRNLISDLISSSASGIIINDSRLNKFRSSKYFTYQHFSRFMPKTFLLSKSNYQEIISKLATDEIVIKPDLGTGGAGISVVNKNKFDIKHFNLNKTKYIVQEFIETKNGIEGIIKDRHDLRVIIFNGKIKLCYLRVPKKGKVLANIAQGGKFIYLEPKNIPEEIRKMVKSIDEKFNKYFPRFYSLDFFVSFGKPYLIEFNGKVGMPSATNEKYDHYYSRFHRYIFETLISGLE